MFQTWDGSTQYLSLRCKAACFCPTEELPPLFSLPAPDRLLTLADHRSLVDQSRLPVRFQTPALDLRFASIDVHHLLVSDVVHRVLSILDIGLPSNRVTIAPCLRVSMSSKLLPFGCVSLTPPNSVEVSSTKPFARCFSMNCLTMGVPGWLSSRPGCQHAASSRPHLNEEHWQKFLARSRPRTAASSGCTPRREQHCDRRWARCLSRGGPRWLRRRLSASGSFLSGRPPKSCMASPSHSFGDCPLGARP